MCRSIHTLHNYEPPADEAEIRAAALQYIRKISGMTKPARANQAAFDEAVNVVAEATHRLLHGLTSSAPAHSREADQARARQRWERRQRGVAQAD